MFLTAVVERLLRQRLALTAPIGLISWQDFALDPRRQVRPSRDSHLVKIIDLVVQSEDLIAGSCVSYKGNHRL